MVPVTFRTVLFLILVALSQVLAESIQKETLQVHNLARALYGAENLAWSNTLAEAAVFRANTCRPGKLSQYGENVAIASSVTEAVAGIWEKERTLYYAKDFNHVYTNFTQIIWKNTKEVGCAVGICGPGSFDPHHTVSHVACEYSPRGNIPGQAP